MALRYLIYRTDFDNTIVRESAVNNPDGGQNEKSFHTDFIIPEIQPLYLWRIIESGINPIDVEPNSDENINDWLEYTAPPPDSQDDATVGFVTGITSQKINIVTGATNNLGVFLSDGNLKDSGLTIDELTGSTAGAGGGIYSARYKFSNDVTDSKPGAGYVRIDNLDPNLVANIYIDNINNNSVDVGNFYAALEVGDVFGLRNIGDSSISYIYNVSGIPTQTATGNTGYVKIPVTVHVVSGSFSNDEELFAAVQYNNIPDESLYLKISDFNVYTGDTETRLTDIEDDISELSGVTTNAITGGTNGITKDGRNLKLGGGLSENTVITGASSFELNVDQIDLKSTNELLIQSESDIDITTVDNTGGTKFDIKIDQNEAVITDNTNDKHGLKYNTNYNSTFDTRSLIDKGYADAIASGLDTKPSVMVATTGETIDITGGTFIGVIDGYTVLNGNRVLIKDQTNAVENGVYIYNSSGNDFTRPIDFDNPNVTAGAFVFVETGTSNMGTGWVVLESTLVSVYDINVGSDPMYFSKFSSIAEYSCTSILIP
jgi:hypothetical protein